MCLKNIFSHANTLPVCNFENVINYLEPHKKHVRICVPQERIESSLFFKAKKFTIVYDRHVGLFARTNNSRH